MASDVVRAAPMSTSILEAWWFRLVVRAVLAVLAFLMLRLSADQLRTLSLGHSVDLRFDTSLWLESIGSRHISFEATAGAVSFPLTSPSIVGSERRRSLDPRAGLSAPARTTGESLSVRPPGPSS